MSRKNKFATVIGGAILIGGLGLAQAQTIQDIDAQAKAKQLLGVEGVRLNASVGHAQETAPPALNASPTAGAATVAVQPKREMVLTGVYNSATFSQAGIDVQGAEIFVGLGDYVLDNWVVAAISDNKVTLKRCEKSSRCETKVLSYTLTR